jgi:hypothetical protein
MLISNEIANFQAILKQSLQLIKKAPKLLNSKSNLL